MNKFRLQYIVLIFLAIIMAIIAIKSYRVNTYGTVLKTKISIKKDVEEQLNIDSYYSDDIAEYILVHNINTSYIKEMPSDNDTKLIAIHDTYLDCYILHVDSEYNILY